MTTTVTCDAATNTEPWRHRSCFTVNLEETDVDEESNHDDQGDQDHLNLRPRGHFGHHGHHHHLRKMKHHGYKKHHCLGGSEMQQCEGCKHHDNEKLKHHGFGKFKHHGFRKFEHHGFGKIKRHGFKKFKHHGFGKFKQHRCGKFKSDGLEKCNRKFKHHHGHHAENHCE